jgi:hypothetical protein
MINARMGTDDESAERIITTDLRMSGSPADDMGEFAASGRMGVATLIDRAVADYARLGSKPPSQRLPRPRDLRFLGYPV